MVKIRSPAGGEEPVEEQDGPPNLAVRAAGTVAAGETTGWCFNLPRVAFELGAGAQQLRSSDER